MPECIFEAFEREMADGTTTTWWRCLKHTDRMWGLDALAELKRLGGPWMGLDGGECYPKLVLALAN